MSDPGKSSAEDVVSTSKSSDASEELEFLLGDENQDLNCYVVDDHTMSIPSRYSIINTIGKGAYGFVVSAKILNTKEKVAIKNITNMFDHISFTKRTLRELRILRHLKHENIVNVREVFITESKAAFKDVYVVTDLLDTDLSSVIKSTQEINDQHCKFFIYQIFRGVKYIHSAEIIHRDLKPRNLIVNANCDLKICDFGLARLAPSADSGFESVLTDYVCTRWYRAPEVICCAGDYSKTVDIWSIGCIFAEILGRKAIFRGKDSQSQLSLIISSIGNPTEKELAAIPSTACKKFIKSLPSVTGKKWTEIYPKGPVVGCDLIHKMLRFHPDDRVTVEEALQHPYLEELYMPSDEPTRSPLRIEEFDFERRKMTRSAFREELYREILEYFPHLRERYLEHTKHNPPYTGLQPMASSYDGQSVTMKA